MRGAQLAVNILLFLLVMILFYFQFNGKNEAIGNEGPKKLATTDTLGKSIDRLVVRYINTDSIWSNYEYVKLLNAELNKQQQQYEAELNRKVKEFQADVQEFQQGMATMSMEQGQQKQEELMLKESQLQKLQEEYNLKLIEAEEKMKAQLRNKITAFLQNFKEDNVDLIMDNSSNSGVLLYQDSFDITSEVLKGLNAEVMENQSVE